MRKLRSEKRHDDLLEGRLRYCFGGGKDSPDPPNYQAAASTQGNADIQTALLNNIMGNPNRRGADGSSSIYNQSGSYTIPAMGVKGQEGYRPSFQVPLYTLTEQVSPQNQRINQGLGDVSEKGLQYVQDALNKPFDQSSLPQNMVNAGETGQEAIMRRLQPQLERNRESLQQQLANQGIAPGGEAYQNAQDQQGRNESDLYSQAALQGIDLGQQARSQAIQEQNFFRNEPLNMLNAVRTGQQIGLPQFSQFNSAMANSPNFMQAAQGDYSAALNSSNAQNAGQAGMTTGLVGLASAAAMAF